MSITDTQIEDLEREAGQAGDVEMARICQVARGISFDGPDERAGITQEIAGMTREQARAECARVIADAAASAASDNEN